MRICRTSLQFWKVGEVEMNMIDYNKAVEALEKERQYLLNREQYGAENVLVKHAINVIHELPIIRQPEVIHCKDCKYYRYYGLSKEIVSQCIIDYRENQDGDWYCADGERRSEA